MQKCQSKNDASGGVGQISILNHMLTCLNKDATTFMPEYVSGSG